MCRSGPNARRCPSSFSETNRKLANAKKRWNYATEKFNESSVIDDPEQKYALDDETFDNFEKQQRKQRNAMAKASTEVGRLKLQYEKEHQIEVLHKRTMPSPQEIGFEETINFEHNSDLDYEKKLLKAAIEFRKRLSEDEKNVLGSYVGNGYKELNYALRDDSSLINSNLSNIESSDDLCSKVAILDRIIERNSNATEPTSVFRGVKSIALINSLIRAESGTAIQFPSYSSTSKSAFEALDFAGRHYEAQRTENYNEVERFGRKVILEMRTRRGADIGGVEEEVILPRKTTWRVAGHRVIDYKAFQKTPEKVIVIQLVDDELLNEIESNHKK